jgi:hypothetical protein
VDDVRLPAAVRLRKGGFDLDAEAAVREPRVPRLELQRALEAVLRFSNLTPDALTPGCSA